MPVIINLLSPDVLSPDPTSFPPPPFVCFLVIPDHTRIPAARVLVAPVNCSRLLHLACVVGTRHTDFTHR